MIKFFLKLVAYIIVWALAMILAPVLPLFKVMRYGAANNRNEVLYGPYLPDWLYWFSTNYDNSLYGDHGWQTEHYPKLYKTYIGMVLWLWRNPACGFAWSVASARVGPATTFTYTHSGRGLSVDKGKGLFGWYFIKSSNGLFSYRWCTKIWRFVISFEAGWLLDIYLKDPVAMVEVPNAVFQFQPQIRFKI